MRSALLDWFRSTPQTGPHDSCVHAGHSLLSETPGITENTTRRTVAVDFSHRGTTIHCMGVVDRRHEERLLLRISSEVGTTSLLGLVGEERGQIEIDNLLIPFRVVRVRLPFVDVLTFPQQARPVRRQFLRMPAPFSIRLRRQGSQGLWITGHGVDISAGGCAFLLTPPCVPIPHARYDIDMLMTLPQSGEIRPQLNGSVRWVRASNRHIATGVEVQNPGQRKVLTLAVSEIQKTLMRRHDGHLV